MSLTGMLSIAALVFEVFGLADAVVPVCYALSGLLSLLDKLADHWDQKLESGEKHQPGTAPVRTEET